MTPRQLLDSADRCSDDDCEGGWRSAAHWSYFSAFHAARDLLERAGFAVPDSERAHAYLWHRLQNCGHREVEKAGSDLSVLRTARNGANYSLRRPLTQKLAYEQVALASSVLEILEQVADSPEVLSRITEAMRVYERDVLREVTWAESE